MPRRGFRFAFTFAITWAISCVVLAGPVAAAHAVKIHGQGTMLASQIFDLDNGHLSPPGIADMFYEDQDGVHLFLDTSGDTKNRVMGAAQPSFKKCSTATLATHRTPVEQLPDGTYLCWKTSGHRFARVRILSHSTSQIDFSYTTWTR
jgi:hypothetical protein